ncbi:helix-turn-helix domain-containing protein [Burkholderia sp. DN3021]|uniref:helix-turn-helix domain-containing protein n=1 Tax=Burkholderia sp. DN3021 TaxID=3410137 RepID=UPI003C7BC43B
MTQEDKILKHLRTAGSITQREALMDLSIQSLTRRITTLRDRGFNIHGVPKIHPLTRQRYMRYVLGTPERHAIKGSR